MFAPARPRPAVFFALLAVTTVCHFSAHRLCDPGKVAGCGSQPAVSRRVARAVTGSSAQKESATTDTPSQGWQRPRPAWGLHRLSRIITPATWAEDRGTTPPERGP